MSMSRSFYYVLTENNFPNWYSNLTSSADQTLEWYTEGLVSGAEAKNCEAVHTALLLLLERGERERERELQE